MPSPFPGMNPYFEQPDLWRGFHGGFLVHLVGAVTQRLDPRYYVEYEESIYIDRPRPFAVADVSVADPVNEAGGRGGTAVAVGAPVTATVVVPKPVRKKRRWLTIRDSKERTVVTVIEVLSPSDKRPGDDRDRYLAKRDRVLGSSANLVEIDLLRGGHRPPVSRPPACDYRVMVARRAERPRVGLWPVGLHDPLPAIPVPLRPGEAEPLVELKLVLDRVYDEMGFARRLYDGQPDPPLPPIDAEWAKAFVPPAS